MQSLVHRFDRFFKVILANTPECREHLYRLRYLVYCREYAWEREENCQGGREQDEFDKHAIHAIMIHRQSGHIAGGVRVIPASAVNPLPIERCCRDTFMHLKLRPDQVPREQSCEISRLAVSKNFRRRRGEDESPKGFLTGIDENDIRSWPLISTVLFMTSLAMVNGRGMNDIFAMMEPRLERFLHRSGICFTPIGRLTDYHGLRAAYHLSIQEAVSGFRPELREAYQFVYRKLWKREA